MNSKFVINIRTLRLLPRSVKGRIGIRDRGKNAYVEQFHTFPDVNRDPCERIITVAHYALVQLSDVKGGDDAALARWFSMNEGSRPAFDHNRILRMAVNRLKERI